MDIMHLPSEYQAQCSALRCEGLWHALVPTMGALHEGHFRLMTEARKIADRVSVSIFVNPIQFNNPDDLEKYPRTLEQDSLSCRELGVDLLFAPEIQRMYPEGFQTHVDVETLTGPLCGAHRPGHFQGVTTVVAKLFNLAQPTHAVFGWKDAQQFLVLRRMVRDLDFPIEMVGIDTVREYDGLAKSSRNKNLSAQDRRLAPQLHEALQAAHLAFAKGEARADKVLQVAHDHLAATPRIELEYLEVRSLETLELLETIELDHTLLAIAAYLGGVRLIDNIRI